MEHSNFSDRDLLPAFNRDWALFLDVDGTLLDFAERPQDAFLHPSLMGVLESLRGNIPLALVSGRPITDLDRLFAPLVLPIAGQHGAERRSADGQVVIESISRANLQNVLDNIKQWTHSKSGILIEDKGLSVALHYRLAPQLKDAAASVVRAALESARVSHEMVAGNMVWEIRPAGRDKGRAIEAFMTESPFADRIPVFIGDDVGDEEGFRRVNRCGGHSFKVGIGDTAARFCFSDVGAVLAWLGEYADWLNEQCVASGAKQKETSERIRS